MRKGIRIARVFGIDIRLDWSWLLIFVLVGAFLGHWLAGQLGLPTLLTINIDGHPFPIIWSIIGSVILVAIAALFTRRRTVVV